MEPSHWTAWLVELRVPEVISGPVWLAGFTPASSVSSSSWTPVALDAVHFVRKKDAETAVRDLNLPASVEVTEHVFGLAPTT